MSQLFVYRYLFGFSSRMILVCVESFSCCSSWKFSGTFGYGETSLGSSIVVLSPQAHHSGEGVGSFWVEWQCQFLSSPLAHL